MVRLTGFILITLVISSAPLLAQEQRPNFLFVLTDDQRFDALGYAGHPILKTPNLDQLAAKGVRFPNSFVTTPICAASRASILSGTYERTHKYTFGTPPLSGKLCDESYPAMLRKSGYRTGLIGKVGVSFEEGQPTKMFDLLSSIGYPYLRKQANGEIRHIDEIATDRAIEFLSKQPTEKPFCLSICFNSPHAEDGELDNLYPWPKTVDGLYNNAIIPLPPLVDEKYFLAEPKFLQEAINRIRWKWQFDTPEKFQKNVRSYYRMISGIDHEIGRLTTELKRLGVEKNTIIVFMSDNGYFLGERGLSGKWIHYEESLRVPLLIVDPRLPARRQGTTATQMALNIDIAPTILEFAGLRIPKQYQGKSLAPLVRGNRPSWRHDFFCEHLLVDPTIPQWEGVRDERYVYARYFGQKPVYEYLHDLRKDPQEVHNLVGDKNYGGVLEKMKRRLKELKESVGGEYSRERFPLKAKPAKT
ncbi:MAG: sulfatase [Armatimonadota bacterium]